MIAAAMVGILIGFLIRLVLLPTQGYRGDIDQFVVWVQHIATNGLPNTFDENLSFGPVMAYIWALLGIVEPGFRSATDAADPWLRALMKLPAVLADFGLAWCVAYALRARPGWAVVGAVAVLLNPAVWLVSAWWGQYESVYALAGLVAVLLALNGRDGLAAAALAVAVLVKPQAVPFLIPFAAWFFARGGFTGLLRAVAIGGAVALIIWLPFLTANGPVRYLESLAEYQNDVFSVLSLNAWNIWWLLQEIGADGNQASDRVAILGPLSFRLVGLLITGLLWFVVANRVWRDHQPRMLLLGLAASVMIAFTFLTTMHERYAYGAVVFLMLLLPDTSTRWLALAFSVVFGLNLLAAIPVNYEFGSILPKGGILGIAGSVAMIALTVLAIRSVYRSRAPS